MSTSLSIVLVSLCFLLFLCASAMAYALLVRLLIIRSDMALLFDRLERYMKSRAGKTPKSPRRPPADEEPQDIPVSESDLQAAVASLYAPQGVPVVGAPEPEPEPASVPHPHPDTLFPVKES